MPDKDSDRRHVILDLSFPFGESVNEGIPKEEYCGDPITLKYPTIDTLAARIADLHRYFRQIPLCLREYSLIDFCWRNLLYFDKVMPMGLRSAAYVCQRVTSAITFIHASLGFWAINYLDDFGSAEHRNKAWDSFNCMTKIMKAIGTDEAEQKAVPPMTRLEFLGNTVDSEKLTIEVSDHRKTEILQLIDSWERKKMYNKKQLQSLIGKLSFITNCVQQGCIFISRLLEVLRTLPMVGYVKVPNQVIQDLRWWKEFLPTFDGVSILWLQDCLQIDEWLATDSSMIGGGSTHDKQFFHLKFPQKILESTINIAQRELFTILVTLKLWKNKLTGKVVRISTDSQVSMFAVNTGRTRDDEFTLSCIKDIAWVCAKHQILL